MRGNSIPCAENEDKPLDPGGGADRVEHPRVVWSDIQILQRALGIAVECANAATSSDVLSCSLAPRSHSMLSSSSWTLPQQRSRAVTHYTLIVQVLGKKCEIIEQLVREALEVYEKERSLQLEDQSKHQSDAGAHLFPRLGGTLKAAASGVSPIADVSSTATSPVLIDMTLLPPGLEEEDYREEMCFLDAVAMKDVNAGGETIPIVASAASGVPAAALPFPLAASSHLVFPSAGAGDSKASPTSVWQGHTGSEDAERKVRWLCSLFAKLNTEALPIASVARRSGLEADLESALASLGLEHPCSPATGYTVGTWSTASPNSFCPALGFGASDTSLVPTDIEAQKQWLRGVNPLLRFHSTPNPSTLDFPCSPFRSLPAVSPTLHSPLGLPLTSPSLGSYGIPESCSLPPSPGFSLRVFFASLRWNIAALLWSDGQVEECGRWLQSIRTEEIWERLQEMGEKERPRGAGAPVRQAFLHSTLANDRTGAKDEAEGSLSDSLAEEPERDPAEENIETASILSWRGLLGRSLPMRWTDGKPSPVAFTATSPWPLSGVAHTRRLLHRISSMRDLCRLIVSAGESFSDVVALLHHLHNALQRQEEYLTITIKRLHSARSRAVAQRAAAQADLSSTVIPPHMMEELEREEAADWRRAGDRQADTVAQTLILLHIVVEFALSRRARYLFRHRLIQDGIFTFMLPASREVDGSHASLNTAAGNPASPAHRPDNYGKSLEHDSVCSACSELIRLVSGRKCQSVYELREVGLPSASYPAPFAEHSSSSPLSRRVSCPKATTTSAASELVDSRLPYVLGANVLQIALHFASSYQSSRIYHGVAAGEEVNFHSLLSCFILERQTAAGPAVPSHRASAALPHTPSKRASSCPVGPASAEAAVAPVTSVVPSGPLVSTSLVRGSAPHASGLRGHSTRNPLSDADGWRYRPIIGAAGLQRERSTTASAPPSGISEGAPATAGAIERGGGVLGGLKSFVSAITGASPPTSSVQKTSQLVAEDAARARRPVLAPGDRLVTEQLQEAYRLFTWRYASTEEAAAKALQTTSPTALKQRLTVRGRRWITPPCEEDRMSCSATSSVSSASSGSYDAVPEPRRRVARQRRALAMAPFACAALRKETRPCRSPASSSASTAPPAERLVCLWLPTRGAVPLLPEEENDRREEAQWEQHRSPSPRSTGVESPRTPSSAPALPFAATGTSASDSERRTLSLRLLVLLHHMIDGEDVLTEVNPRPAGPNPSALQAGLLEPIPVQTLRTVTSELNKAIYLLPQRIQKLQTDGEAWWRQWVSQHRHHVQHFYTRALKGVFEVEEGERVASASHRRLLAEGTNAEGQPAALESSHAAMEGRGRESPLLASSPRRRIVFSGKEGGAKDDTSSHLLVQEHPAAADPSHLPSTTVVSVMWDLPPFFLPEIRLDITAFTTATIETEANMKRTAAELSQRQAELDDRYRQQCVAAESGVSLLDTVVQRSPSMASGGGPPALSVLDGPARHALHDALPFSSQFVHWKMMYNSSTHGLSLQTLYQCCAAESAARCRGPFAAEGLHAAVPTHTPMLLLVEVMPSFTESFDRDGEGVRTAAAWARAEDLAREGIAARPAVRSGVLCTPNRLIVGAYLSDLLLCDTRRYYGSSDSFVFQVLLPGQRDMASVPAPALELFRASGANTQFLNCRRTSVMIGGGSSESSGSALYLDASLSRGATASCSTFQSPPLTEWNATRVETRCGSKSFEILRVEAIVFDSEK